MGSATLEGFLIMGTKSGGGKCRPNRPVFAERRPGAANRGRHAREKRGACRPGVFAITAIRRAASGPGSSSDSFTSHEELPPSRPSMSGDRRSPEDTFIGRAKICELTTIGFLGSVHCRGRRYAGALRSALDMSDANTPPW